ncbi:MAG TPA: toll/interleukin-1 receptor domain-containing protein [Candidatus Eisenbacteria bacterium]
MVTDGAQPPELRDVFVSHRSVDKPFARKLATAIEREKVDGRSLTVWLDEAEIRTGQSVTGMVNLGLEHSRFVALVLTPDYFQSESGWTDAEWHAALFVDPDNRQARILPLLAADCPYVPILLRHLLFEDFRGSNYSQALARLLRVLRNEPLPRPITHRGQLIRPSTYIDRVSLVAERSIAAADPDAAEENLSCNLLPVERIPTRIYRAPIAPRLRRARRDGSLAFPTKEELKDLVRRPQSDAGVEKPIMPAFRMNGDHLVTFHDLESPESLLSPIVMQSKTEVLDATQFVLDGENRKLVASLLNMGIDRHLFARGLTVDRSRPGASRFFYPPDNGRERVIEWRPFQNKSKRTVAKPYHKGNEVPFWIHQAAYIKPVFLAAKFFLQITPTWLLTEDGTRVKGGREVGRVVIQWTGRERNTSILYHVRFWTWVLGSHPGPITVRLGDQTMEVSPVPAYIHQTYGIDGDQRNLMVELDRDAAQIARAENAAEVEEADQEEAPPEEIVSEESSEGPSPETEEPEATR